MLSAAPRAAAQPQRAKIGSSSSRDESSKGDDTEHDCLSGREGEGQRWLEVTNGPCAHCADNSAIRCALRVWGGSARFAQKVKYSRNYGARGVA